MKNRFIYGREALVSMDLETRNGNLRCAARWFWFPTGLSFGKKYVGELYLKVGQDP